jgi:chemotaxis protein methyltransferase CheR
MNDDACVRFLQWCLPKMDKRWDGFRKVRGQVCKRITRRMQDLNLTGLSAYREYLDARPDEWNRLDAMCRITISRFYRDRGVFEALRDPLLPALSHQLDASDGVALRAWSAGCASGEEPYTLRLCWDLGVSKRESGGVELQITATDAQTHMLERARRGCYPHGTLKELPADWIEAAFTVRGASAEDPCCIRSPYRQGIVWLHQDIRQTMPDGPFHLILCRNLVFTYFNADLQRTCLARMLDRLAPRGLLLLGKHETLPKGDWPLDAWDKHKRIYRKAKAQQ